MVERQIVNASWGLSLAVDDQISVRNHINRIPDTGQKRGIYRHHFQLLFMKPEAPVKITRTEHITTTGLVLPTFRLFVFSNSLYYFSIQGEW